MTDLIVGGLMFLLILSVGVHVITFLKWGKDIDKVGRLQVRCVDLATRLAIHDPDFVASYWGHPMIKKNGGGWESVDE